MPVYILASLRAPEQATNFIQGRDKNLHRLSQFSYSSGFDINCTPPI
jgi:hypothetical protein